MSAPPRTAHARLMDGVYRRQRHVYDATRKFYLLGRDALIAELDVPAGGTALELGCGTGRNLALAARRYPDARFFGLDISSQMLASAERMIFREGVEDRVMLALGDAAGFDAGELFGRKAFDRVYVSYALSMIPAWEAVIASALSAAAPGGSLHVVDFGRQERLPAWTRTTLRAWLRQFHVTPRDSLREVLESECERLGASLAFDSLFCGYAAHAAVRMPRN